jgi:HAD superfamily hydrolase (TIGR01490 family)
MTIAAFDLDGTLSTGHIIHGIVRHHRTHRVKRLALLLYMATHTAMWPLYRLGLVSELEARGRWLRDMAWTIRGWTPEQAATAFAWIAEHDVLPRVRQDVLQRLRDHQAQGHRVVIVSGTLSPLLAAIGKALAVEETVGTEPALKGGRYSGGTLAPACQGAGKILRLQQHLGDVANVKWRDSYAYADSCTDLPLLERVGHPVAVYPDDELAALAEERGWEIIGS